MVWLDDDTSVRALVNSSRMPEPETVAEEAAKPSKGVWSDYSHPPADERKDINNNVLPLLAEISTMHLKTMFYSAKACFVPHRSSRSKVR